MRVAVIWFLLLVPVLRADIIHLKNGRKISADHVHEAGQQVEFEIGGNSYTIPKSLVERIELEWPAPARAATSDKPFPLNEAIRATWGVADQVVHDGKVDPEALVRIERAGKPRDTAAGFFVAARHELEHGDRERARFYYERALMFTPESELILTHYAALLTQMGSAPDAVPAAEHATRLAPNSADAFVTLGYAYFGSDRSHEAVYAWRRALQLRSDATIARFLAIAERELKAETTFSQTENQHFRLRYDAGQISAKLRDEFLAVLDADYASLEKELGISPSSSIPVILYANEAFFDVTQGPSWSSGINDGKLRLSLAGATRVTPEMARTLKHELAHSFINQASRGRCPQWLNEGIAQLVEPKSAAGGKLAQLFLSRQHLPLNTLENSFLQFEPSRARLAYDEALAATEFLRDTYGMDALRHTLERIGSGASTEAALRENMKLGYAELEQQLGEWLKKYR